MGKKDWGAVGRMGCVSHASMMVMSSNQDLVIITGEAI